MNEAIKIMDDKDDDLFPFNNSGYQDKVTKEVSKIMDTMRKRNRHFIYIVPENATKRTKEETR